MVNRYFRVLKSPEHVGIVEPRTVDEIFFMVPDILEIHEKFLEELRSRLNNWDTQQRVGDAFMDTVRFYLFQILFNLIAENFIFYSVFQTRGLRDVHFVCEQLQSC